MKLRFDKRVPYIGLVLAEVGKRRSLAALLIALAVGQAAATTIIPMSVERLARASTMVVRASALDSRSQWNSQHTLIFTYTRFAVLSRLKGSAAQTIVVRQMGGSAEGYRQVVYGARSWQAGEEAVLFLRPSVSGDGTLVVTGLMQGDFRVRREADGSAVVSNGVSGVEMFDESSRTVRPFGGARMTLTELERRVREAGQQ